MGLLMLAGDAGFAQTAEPDRALSVPVSLSRIRQQLAEAPSSDESGLRLEFHLEVVGKLPALDLFRDFDFRGGPVPFSAPSHRDFLAHVTPEEFRSPVANFNGVFDALREWFDRRKKERESPPKR